MHKKLILLTLPVVFLTLAVVGFLKVTPIHAQTTTISFDPATISLNPGDSVVGSEKILQYLVIGQSDGHDVVYIKDGVEPAAYGGDKTGPAANDTNACLPKSFGMVDHIAGDTRERKHSYDFSFKDNFSVDNFKLQLLDWGDYMPFGACPDNRCAISLVAYNSVGEVVASDTIAYTSADATLKRETVEFGNTAISGDACEAAPQQPGNYTFNISGPGITRLHLGFKDQGSMDPNVAIGDMSFTLESVVSDSTSLQQVSQDTTPTPTPESTPTTTPNPTPNPSPTNTTATTTPTPVPTIAPTANPIGGTNDGQVLAATTLKRPQVLGLESPDVLPETGANLVEVVLWLLVF